MITKLWTENNDFWTKHWSIEKKYYIAESNKYLWHQKRSPFQLITTEENVYIRSWNLKWRWAPTSTILWFCQPCVIYLLEESQPRLLNNAYIPIIRVEHLHFLVTDHTVDDNPVPPLQEHHTAKLSRLYRRLRHDVTIRNKLIWITASAKHHKERLCLEGCKRWTQKYTGLQKNPDFSNLNDTKFQKMFKWMLYITVLLNLNWNDYKKCKPEFQHLNVLPGVQLKREFLRMTVFSL